MARYSEEIIQQVAAANDIVDVIGGYFPLRRAGSTYKALCPFHQEKSPSFTVNPARQIFKCFGCGAGGSVIRFVMDYEHLDFGSALKRLADRGGIRLEEQELSREDRDRLDLRRRLLELHREAAEFFHRNLLRSSGAQRAREYLKGRGIHSETAKSWQLGYAPEGWDGLLRWASEKGFRRAELLASGLVTQRDPDSESSGIYDRFRDRVMFPICNDTGEVIAFSGRVLQADAKAAKYVNSPETPLFSKGAVLFGLHRSKRALIEKNSAIVCEGQLDLITAFEAGIQNVIAPQGTAFTPKQARILRRYVEEVVLCFDSDAAGQKAAERSLPSLLAEKLSVRVVKMPDGQDPDSVIRTQGGEAFRSLAEGALDYFSYQLRQITAQSSFQTPRVRAAAARSLAESLSHLSDPVLRDVQIQAVATGLGLDPVAMGDLVREAAVRGQNFPSTGDFSQSQDSGSPNPETSTVSLTDQTLRLMALTILHSEEARQWLMEEDWRARLAPEIEGEVLVRILEGSEHLRSAGGAASLLASLSSAEESIVSELLTERPPEHPLPVLHDCWNELERKQIRRRIDALKASQRSPNLSLQDSGSLHEQILDLQKRLSDVSRPFFPGP